MRNIYIKAEMKLIYKGLKINKLRHNKKKNLPLLFDYLIIILYIWQ